MEIGTTVANAFAFAQAKYPDLNAQWVRIGGRVGGPLPKSLLMATIQRDGAVDLLLRYPLRLNHDFAPGVRSHDLVRKVCNFSGSCSCVCSVA
jgi:hypothetical protein